jgi:hypothetical protein
MVHELGNLKEKTMFIPHLDYLFNDHLQNKENFKHPLQDAHEQFITWYKAEC